MKAISVILAIFFVLLSISFPIASAGFLISSTSQWDAGIKSNDSGNYEIETYSDNLIIENNSLQLSNLYSNRFTFDDADGLTWKWGLGNLTAWGIYDTNDYYDTIENGVMNITFFNQLSSPYSQLSIKEFNTNIEGDFDAKVDLYLPESSTGDSPEALFLIWKADDSGAYCYVYPVFNNIDTWILGFKCTDDYAVDVAGSMATQYYAQPGLNLSMRIQRIGTNCRLFYDVGMTGEWTYASDSESEGWGDCFSGQARVELYANAGWHDDDNFSFVWDNLYIDSIPEEIPVLFNGNWLSDDIILPLQNILSNLTITFFNPNADTCISDVQILINNSFQAGYDTGICNMTTTSETVIEDSARGIGIDYYVGYFPYSTPAFYDNDWDSYAYSTNGKIYLNYKIPLGASNNSVWRVKDGSSLSEYDDLVLPNECLNGSELNLMVNNYKIYAKPFYKYYTIWNCWNGASWENLRSNFCTTSSCSFLYEESMIWDIQTSSITLNSTDLTSGSFFGALGSNNVSFNINLTLDGDGYYSPAVKTISGEYFDLTTTPSGECVEQNVEIITEGLDRNIVYFVIFIIIVIAGILIIKFI